MQFKNLPPIADYGFSQKILEWRNIVHHRFWMLDAQSLQEGFQESEILNKRTNGDVNAHLRSGIYTNKQDLAIK